MTCHTFKFVYRVAQKLAKIENSKDEKKNHNILKLMKSQKKSDKKCSKTKSAQFTP